MQKCAMIMAFTETVLIDPIKQCFTGYVPFLL